MKYMDMKMYEQAETNLLLMYSNVRQVEPGIFGIMENGKYGFADARKPDIKIAEPKFTTAHYRKNYVYLSAGTYYSKEQEGIMYFIPTSTEIKCDKTTIQEYSTIDYRLASIVYSNELVGHYDTETAQLLGTSVYEKFKYRPYDPYFVLSFLDKKTEKLVGITPKFEKVDVLEYLATVFKSVKTRRSKIVAELDDGHELELTEFGQLY